MMYQPPRLAGGMKAHARRAGCQRRRPAGCGLRLVRYNPDGSLDPTFGDGGRVLLGFDRSAGAESVAITPDGKIVAAGATRAGGQSGQFAVVRLNPNGSLDPTFDGDGRRVIEFDGRNATGPSVAVQADGKVFLAGNISSNPALIRLNTDGSFDPTFDGDGILNSPGSMTAAYDLALDGDRPVLAGTVATNEFAVARFTPTGAPDTSFHGGGVATPNFGAVAGHTSAPGSASDVVVMPDGRIVATGTVSEKVTFMTSRAMVGVARFNVANPLGVELTADEFVFSSMYANGSAWTGPWPALITTQHGAGAGGSNRVTLVWNDYNPRRAVPDQAVANGWLEVTVQPGTLGLATPYVFRFGNLIGGTEDGAAGDIARDGLAVGAADVLATRAAQFSRGASGRFDFNRDGRVNVLDLAVARANVGNRLAPPEALATTASALTPPARNRRGAYLLLTD